MPFLGPRFDHDVFVSYAHARGGDLKHWSQCLVERVKHSILYLAVEIEEPDIFIDLKLDPARRLTDQLKGKVRASGLLLIIMSDHYLQSAWCMDELEWFESELEACQKEGGLVLVVRALPTDHQA